MLSMRFNPLHQAIPIGTLTARIAWRVYYRHGVRWFNHMTHIDPMWKVLITGFLRRPDDLFYFFCRSEGILAARGAALAGRY